MIDCSKFRKLKLADPMCRDIGVLDHARLCPPCAKYAAKLEQFEQTLRVSAVDACGDMPPDLCDRILAQEGQQPAPGNSSTPRRSWLTALITARRVKRREKERIRNWFGRCKDS